MIYKLFQILRKLDKILRKYFGNTYLFGFLYRVALWIRVVLVIKPRFSRSLTPDFIPVEDITSTQPVVVVPLLETSHYHHYHILAMAKAFSLRGYAVLVVVCDEYLPACEIKSCRTYKKTNYCSSCTANRSHILDLFKLNYVELSSILSDVLDPVLHGEQVFSSYGMDKERFDIIIEDSVTRHFYGAEDIFDSNLVDEIRADHRKTAYISLALGDVLLKKYGPTICFNNMKVYSAWGPLFDLLESQGVVPILLNMTQFNINAIRLNNTELFRHKRTFERFLSSRDYSLLIDTENEALDAFLNNRKSGNDYLMKEWDYFQTSSIAQIGIKNSRKNVFLFPNLPWDQGISEFGGAFPNVLDWVNTTIEYLSDHSEIDLWIKPHPVEVRGTSKSERSVSQFIKSKYPVLPDNIHVIDAELGINTYSLFPYIDLGVVLTGTLGLEIALEGIPIISAGINPVYGLGLLSEPASVAEYFEAIESGDNSIKRMGELRRFCYFYFIHQCFNWPLTERAFLADNLKGFSFSSVSDLEEGKISDLDTIFREIECLIGDFKIRQSDT